jgi:hypothetical protein
MTDDREKALDEVLRSLLGHPLGYLAGYEAAAGRVRELFRERIPVAEVREMLLRYGDLRDEAPLHFTAEELADAILRKAGYGETEDADLTAR